MYALKAKVTPRKIEYWPNHSALRGDFVGLIIAVLLSGVACFGFLTDPAHSIFAFLLILALLVLVLFSYRLLFKDHLMLIFDLDTRAIYKKQPWGLRWKVMDFDEINLVMTEAEYNHFQYCLTRKGNTFSRHVKISDGFHVHKPSRKRNEYEQALLPAILDMIKIGAGSRGCIGQVGI